MSSYLKVDSTKVSYGEYRRWKPGPAFVVLAAAKLLRVRFPATILVPAVARIDMINPLRRPPELMRAIEQPLGACQAMGYQLRFWYALHAVGTVVAMGAALTLPDQTSLAMVIGGQSRNGTNREVHLGLASKLRSGRILVTSDGRSLFDPAPVFDSLALRAGSYSAMLDAHAERVEGRRAEISDVWDALELIRQIEQAQIDSCVTRGIYVPATQADIDRAARLQGPGA